MDFGGAIWYNVPTTDEDNGGKCPGVREDGFISDENPNEGWEVTPLDPGGELGDVYDDDDDDDSSFYTEEDYEDCPVLRVMMHDLGGADPLGRDYADIPPPTRSNTAH